MKANLSPGATPAQTQRNSTLLKGFKKSVSETPKCQRWARRTTGRMEEEQVNLRAKRRQSQRSYGDNKEYVHLRKCSRDAKKCRFQS